MPPAKILLITDAYPPEIRSSAILMRELALGLAQSGHQVNVLTTYPKYNMNEDAKKRFSSWKGNIARHEDGLTIWRIPTLPIHHVGPLRKGIGQIALLPILLLSALLIGRHDILLVYSPPLPLGLLAGILGCMWKANVVVNVQDLFPQNAIDLGVLHFPPAIAFWRLIESWTYRLATVIACHSQGNRSILAQHSSASGKVIEIQNWVDTHHFHGISPDHHLKERLRIPPDNRLAIFGGVLGYAQGIDVILRAASDLGPSDRLSILIVGDGVFASHVADAARRLPHLFYHPFVPPDTFATWTVTADIGLVTLDARMATPVVPSKILYFMAAGKPILAALNVQSDGIGIIREAGCGICIPAGDHKAMAHHLRQFSQMSPSDLQSLGQNGYIYCSKHFNKRLSIRKYLHLISLLSNNVK